MLEAQFIGLLIWAALLAIAVFGYVATARAAEKLDRQPRRSQISTDGTVIQSLQRGF